LAFQPGHGFVCRFCGTSDIQNSEYKELKGSDEDIKKYNHVFESGTAKEKQDAYFEEGWKEKSPITELPDLTIWNSAPCDILHDLAEGVIEKLLCWYILPEAIKNLKRKEIADIISNFKFYQGGFSMSYEGKFKFVGAKAVQVRFFFT